jgi:cold shock CspA family protein
MSSSDEPAAATASNNKPTIPTDAPRTTGTVKWFSNRKCFGFLTSHKEGEEDVFVHQSSIHSEGFRTLKEGMVVEYTVGKDENGRPKAEHITAVGGGYITLPPRRTSAGAGASQQKEEGEVAAPEGDGAIQEGAATATEKTGRHRRGGRPSSKNTVAPDHTDELVQTTAPEEEEEEEDEEVENLKNGRKNNKNMPSRSSRGARQSGRGGARAPAVVNDKDGPNFKKDAAAIYWHSALSDPVKQSLINEKNISLKMSYLDLALDNTVRIKLGNEGYATCVHVDGVIAEGKFALENVDDGSISFIWERCIALSDSEDGKNWVAEENPNNLSTKVPRTLSLQADNVTAVHIGDDVAKVWKDDETVPDVRKVLEDNGFAMRRVFWVPPRFGRRFHTTGGGRGGRRGRGGMKTAPPQSAL